jgi:YgiT-type zinc finger domain-containing protein
MINCNACRIGRYRPITLSYLHRLDQQMIIIPNAPAYICDVCKQSHFDPYFLDTLDFLLTRLVPMELTGLVARQQTALTPSHT